MDPRSGVFFIQKKFGGASTVAAFRSFISHDLHLSSSFSSSFSSSSPSSGNPASGTKPKTLSEREENQIELEGPDERDA